MTEAPHNAERLEAQELREAGDRLKVMIRLLSYAHRHQVTGLELAWMVQALELDGELDQLAGTSTERQQRLADVRQQLLELERESAAGTDG
jgi:hypothetical protein